MRCAFATPIAQVTDNAHTPDLMRDLARAAQHAAAMIESDPTAALRGEVQNITVQISRAMDMALQFSDPAPALRKISELEERRNRLQAEITRLEREQTQRAMLKMFTEERVTAALSALVADMDRTPKSQWKNLLHTLIGKVVLDPKPMHCHIHYRVSAQQMQNDTLNMASPRGCSGNPVEKPVRWQNMGRVSRWAERRRLVLPEPSESPELSRIP